MRASSNRPVVAALVGGIIAVAIGAAVMLSQGGELAVPYILLNMAAGLVGLVSVVFLPTVPPQAGRWLAVAAAAALLATALVGAEADGIRRWAMLGPVRMQPAFILLPLLLCAYARLNGDRSYAAAVVIAALAIAIQPDRSMAAALVAVSALPAMRDRTPIALAVLGCCLAALAITILRADPLTGVRFVEHVLADGWRAGSVHGGALTLAALALLAPLATLRQAMPEQRRAVMAFALCWGTLLLASTLAPYPTPLIGYGASAIIGYLLAVIALRA